MLNLTGLYNDERDPKYWMMRVATTKEQVKGSWRCIWCTGRMWRGQLLGCAGSGRRWGGRRWLVADLQVYDWWDLIQDWGAEVWRRVAEREGQERAEALEYTKWIGELMLEGGVRSLPRALEVLGRVLDSREGVADYGCNAGAEDTETEDELGRHR